MSGRDDVAAEARGTETGAARSGLAPGGPMTPVEGQYADVPGVSLHVLSSEQRLEKGRAARRETPRSAHAGWRPAPNRPDPVALLEEQAHDRLPRLVPIRHGRMLASPFAFYRGGALIMAADLATTPRSGLMTQLCGDAHLSNFGLFASPERRLLFDVNDFDETLPGPWEWDVKRLAASFEIAGRDRGFNAADRRDIVMTAVRAYREGMRRTVGMGVLDAWYDHMTGDEMLAVVEEAMSSRLLSKEEGHAHVRAVAKARTRGHKRAFDRLAEETEQGELRIRPNPPLIVPLHDLVEMGRTDIEAWMQQLVATYRESLADHYHPVERIRWVDTALKVVGVGSVGTRAWILLFVGIGNDDPIFLQAKEAQTSVLERFVGRSRYENHGQRVVVGQRLMQATSDIFLGWLQLEGMDGRRRDYYVRQLHDWKGGIEIERLRAPGATLYAELCGVTLARAHARAGERLAIAAYLGKGDTFDRALADFAAAYADQNERDYETFAAAVKSGRLQAETGV